MTEFITMTGTEYCDQLIAMMAALYAEDPFAADARADQFIRTIEHLLANPARGRIMLFSEHSNVCGYALLIPFWSNEFGGNVLVVDEIYVRPEFRKRGIAHAFFQWLMIEKPYAVVSLGLEVSGTNHAARRLYESLGFIVRKNAAMTLALADPAPP